MQKRVLEYEATADRAVAFRLRVYGSEKGLGVTREVGADGLHTSRWYAVTHMASGLKLRSFRHLNEARAALKLLLPLRDWTVPAAELYEQTFIVHCRVSGGVIGTHEAILERDGAVRYFPDLEAARLEAARLTREASSTRLSYWPEVTPLLSNAVRRR